MASLHQPPVIIDGRYISDRYPGIGRYVYDLVSSLAQVSPGLPIALLTGAGEPQTRFRLGELEERGIELIPLRGALRSLGGRLEVRRICRARAPALFHAPHVLSAVPHRCPSVVTIHDLIPIRASVGGLSAAGRLLFRTLLRRALASASVVVTASASVSNELQARWGVSGDRIAVTPLAAGPRFRPAPPDRTAADRARLRLPERYVLYVGNHRPHKNLSLLLQGWSDLQDSRRNGCWLVIAGAIDEPYAEAVRRSREPCRDRVSFLGPVAEADLPSVYRGARILVHPALQEGFGLPIIEAMACGVPVACSRAPALDGTCGAAALRFDAESSIDTARAIDLLLHDDALRETLVVAGLQRAGELTWTRTAELTLSAYRKALSRAGTEALAP